MKVVLGVTGSVSAKLTPKLIIALLSAGHEVQVVATQKSLYFWNLDLVPESVKVWTDEDEWPEGSYQDGALIPHIELVKWADVLLIAPLSKNTLFKIAYGGADNLLTCLAAAWWTLDETGQEPPKPIVIAPAMNTRMWLHPSTGEQLIKLDEMYLNRLVYIEPANRTLACGETGYGALADISDIVEAISIVE